MSLVEEQAECLIEAIQESNEYIHYQEIMKKVMQDEPLYDRIKEFRRKSIAIQVTCEDELLLDEQSNLCDEYNSLFLEPLAVDFLAAEEKYCRMLRDINNQITANLGIDTDYLED
jgi:Protein of unknown function (DUF964).